MIAVTGATGKLGGRVAARLAAAGHEQLLVARDPGRLPDLPAAVVGGPAAYDDKDSMRSALEGADTLFLVSAGLSGRRLEEHSSAIDAAVEAGVQRVLYVSLLSAAEDATYRNARDHAQTEGYLAGADVRSTVLRAGWYSSMMPDFADDQGVIRGPAGDGRVALVSHEDIADVAVSLLLDDSAEHDDATYDITGPEALTFHQVADALSEVTGRPHRYEEQTRDQAVEWRRGIGMTDESVLDWVSWFEAVARGETDVVTDVVPRFAGHPARTLTEALRVLQDDNSHNGFGGSRDRDSPPA